VIKRNDNATKCSHKKIENESKYWRDDSADVLASSGKKGYTNPSVIVPNNNQGEKEGIDKL